MTKEDASQHQEYQLSPPLLQSVVPDTLSTSVSTATKRRKKFPVLEPTPIPHARFVSPQVLSQEEIEYVKHTLAGEDPTRYHSFEMLKAANKIRLSKISRVGVLLDGRGYKEDNGTLIPLRDGWWGDTIQSSSVIRSLLHKGLEVDVYSKQPDLFSKMGNDALNHVLIPEEAFPFQFYPFGMHTHPTLVEFLYHHQHPESAFLSPLNARLPVFFRFEKHQGSVEFDGHTQKAVDALQLAVEDIPRNRFEGITQKQWNRICHHSHAYQVMTELLGLYGGPWDSFPKPYINPSETARFLARSVAKQFSREGINTLLQVGTSTNFAPKAKKAYPVEKWQEILSHIASKRRDLIGSIIMFEPINPQQAIESRKISSFARQMFGEERVFVIPFERDWNLSALTALMDELADNGIVIGVDSGPAHIARARNIPVAGVWNKVFDPTFYAPTGAMIVLPSFGEEAEHVLPKDVAEAFIALATVPQAN